MKPNEAPEPWPCDWDSHEPQQLQRDAARFFRDNLIWREETAEFAERLAKAPTIKHPGFPKILRKD